VGVVAAVSEEILFRGLLQDMFSRWTGHKHLGVWIAAFLFSFIHMQFFGFFPRFFLGALLGYLVLYSGSLWAAIAGHFLNNTLAVILYYLVENGQVQQDPTEQGSWLQALLFLPVFVLFIWQFKRQGQYGS
jgi:membrane protease YdiL (CAAX protease family)